MRRAKNFAHFEHAMLAAAFGIIAFIIIFGAPRSHSKWPADGTAVNPAATANAPLAGAPDGEATPTGIVLTRSAGPAE